MPVSLVGLVFVAVGAAAANARKQGIDANIGGGLLMEALGAIACVVGGALAANNR